ncbi:hypothetical protein C1H46_021662 [Malus baccata]|uniref:Uncharacterized protein n=1 Tax=Malus baccata TaxID=106549 RepID=A0A540M1V7_MALBA|nr:hypothetical protein C1H46_021662 [Malus baccata]
MDALPTPADFKLNDILLEFVSGLGFVCAEVAKVETQKTKIEFVSISCPDLVCKNLSFVEPSLPPKHLRSNPALPTHNPTLSFVIEGRLHLPTHRSRLAPPFSPGYHGCT